jgi:hypothetical protein
MRIYRPLPLRSMVGQLPLEQHIGVRIPEGQPFKHFVEPFLVIQDFLERT